MRKNLSESPGRGKWCSPDLYKFKLDAGSEAAQQMSQVIPSIVVTFGVLTHFVVGYCPKEPSG